MIDPIQLSSQSLSSIELQNSISPKEKGESGALTGVSFSDILKNYVDQVNTHQTQANTAIKELIAGRNKNIHETLLVLERADISLKVMMQVRNKIVDAYKEMMHMQI